MKLKRLSIFLSIVMCAFAGILFSACGEATVKSIYVEEGTINTVVQHNSTFSLQGIKIVAKLSDGKEMEISIEDCEVSSIDTSVVGEQTLTITYGVYETEVTINVVKVLNTISVKAGTIPTTVDHNGELDLSDAVIVLNYSVGEPVEIDADTEGLEFGAVDTTTVGTHKALNISYGGVACVHYYDVVKTLTKIEVGGSYLTRVPFKGQFDTTGITATATYSDNSNEVITNDKLQISTLNTQDKANVKADNVVTVTYQGQEDTITVEVYAVLTRIEYVSGLNDTKYNTELNTSAVTVTAYYNDDTNKTITEGVVVTGYNKQTLGDQELTLSYQDNSAITAVTTTTTINVYEELEELEIQHTNPADATTGYALVDGELDVSKFKIIAVYSKNRVTLNDNAEEYAKVHFSNVDTSAVGDKELTITYNGVSKPITVHVVETWDDVQGLEIESISILNTSVASEVDQNATLDISNLQIVVKYSNNLSSTLDADGEEQIVVTNVNTSTTGVKNLVVTYKETFHAEKAIEVKRTLASIEIQAGTEITSVKYGTTLDLSNVVILAKYSNTQENGEGERVANVTNNASTFDNTNLSGPQTITFTYSEQSVNNGLITRTCSMIVTVYEEIEELVNVSNVQDRVEYGTDYDASSITASVRYTSNRTETVSNENLVFTIDTNSLGTQTLTIEYTENNKTIRKTYDVEVYDVVTSIEIKSGVADSVYVGDTLDTSNIVLTLNYKSGATQDITEGFNVTGISTEQEGNQTLVVEYQNLTARKIVNVKKTYTIIGYNNPTFVESYKQNSTTENTFNKTGSTGVKSFTVLNNEYVVGDDNLFYYQPIMQIKKRDNTTKDVTEFKADIKVYLYNSSNSTYELLTQNATDYVTVDDTVHTFQFTDAAVGKKFKIEVLPYSMTTTEAENVEASVFEFGVIDGYNAYTAKDLSLIDNVNAADKWTEYKNANNISLNANISALILHNNISITDADIPASHFLTEAEVKTTDPDCDRALGSLKDSTGGAYGYLYKRELANGETFTIEGNYFTLSAQELSLIVRQDKDGVLTPMGEGEALTVHTALFGFFGKETNEQMASYNLNNISLFGNTKKSEDVALSGGVMFMKAQSANFTAYNNLSQCWFISYMFEGNSNYSQDSVYTLEKTNCFDAYNTMIYNWAANNLNIKDSVLIGAGGPVMICDHVSNNETTGEGGYITNVKVNNSVLESYIAGSEGWFATYKGSGELVGQIKAFNPLFVAKGKTLCDAKGEKINLVAVYKSGSAEGLTASKIRGTYSIEGRTSGLNISNDEKYLEFAEATGASKVGTAIAYKAAYDAAIAQGADEATAQEAAKAYVGSKDGLAKIREETIKGVNQFASNGMFMQTDSGAVAFPGTDGDWYKKDLTGDDVADFDGTPDQKDLDAAVDTMYVYLPNGMAAVMGIFDYTAKA